MKLIVNIPAYNEEAKIGETIKHIKESFNKDFYINGEGAKITEKLVQLTNDGSTDKTVEMAKEAGVDLVVSYKPNRRLAYAFKQAVENALRNKVDFFVNIDADGQFNPEDIPKLLSPVIKQEVDMTVANRFGEYKAENIPKMKNFLNRFAAGIIGFFLGQKIDDLTCGFRAHSKETLLRLNLANIHFTYTQETIIDAIGKDLKIKWVPVKVSYFADRQSKIVKSVWQFVNNSFRVILKAVRDVRPLKFFGWPGLFFIILGLIGFLAFLAFYFQEFKISPYKNYILFSSISFLLGIQLIVFALLADMIKSNRQLIQDEAYRQKKKRFYGEI